MNNKKNIFDWAALLGLICFTSIFVGFILMVVVLRLIYGSNSFHLEDFHNLQKCFVCIGLLFGMCLLALWMEGWMWVLRTWKDRSVELNVALVIVLVMASGFAGYIFHYYAKSQDKDID
jgi:hypothetical protein